MLLLTVTQRACFAELAAAAAQHGLLRTSLPHSLISVSPAPLFGLTLPKSALPFTASLQFDSVKTNCNGNRACSL